MYYGSSCDYKQDADVCAFLHVNVSMFFRMGRAVIGAM